MIRNLQIATDPYVEPEQWFFEEIIEQAVEDVKHPSKRQRGAMSYTMLKSDRPRAEHFLFFDNEWFPDVCRRMGTTAEFVRACLWAAVDSGIIPKPKESEGAAVVFVDVPGSKFMPGSGPPSLRLGARERRGARVEPLRAASPSNGNGKQARRQVRRGGEVRP